MALSSPSPATLEQNTRPWWFRWINRVGTTLRQRGIAIADLTEASLLSAAQRQTQLSDWGDDTFRLPLQILLNALEQEADLNFMGRVVIRQYLVRLLVNRLQIQNDFKQYPEILQVPIQRPLFILGLPRTGTTFLHRLLAQDPASRWLHFWELLRPSPPPDAQTCATDPRIREAEQLIKRYATLAPAFSTAHYLGAQEPEECNTLFEHAFMSILFELRAHVPSYVTWLKAQDMLPAYEYYRQQLQLLGWRWPGDHWVLKAPVHMFYLDALLEVFPDACIVQTHREPLQVVPSMCSLGAIVRDIYSDRVDLHVIGEHWLHRLVTSIEHAMQVRNRTDETRFYDVRYDTLVQDPVGTVRRIYEYFGYPFTPALETHLNHWLAANPQHKHGVHRYSLEHFGLNPATVDQQFGPYRQRFLATDARS